jgi:hypothetical protein
MKMRNRILGVLVVAMFWIAVPLAAAPLPSSGIFVFSSLCHGEEDAGGNRIVIFREPLTTTAIYWRAEGAILEPLVAYGQDVKIDDRSGKISMRFADPAFGSAGVYVLEGSVSEEALVLDGQPTGPVRLPRVREFGQRLPACKR